MAVSLSNSASDGIVFMSQVTSGFLNKEINESNWISLILILLLARTKGEVIADIIEKETNQEEYQS